MIAALTAVLSERAAPLYFCGIAVYVDFIC